MSDDTAPPPPAEYRIDLGPALFAGMAAVQAAQTVLANATARALERNNVHLAYLALHGELPPLRGWRTLRPVAWELRNIAAIRRWRAAWSALAAQGMTGRWLLRHAMDL